MIGTVPSALSPWSSPGSKGVESVAGPLAVPGALLPRPSMSGLPDPSQPWSCPARSETTPGTQSWARVREKRALRVERGRGGTKTHSGGRSGRRRPGRCLQQVAALGRRAGGQRGRGTNKPVLSSDTRNVRSSSFWTPGRKLCTVLDCAQPQNPAGLETRRQKKGRKTSHPSS